jgi:hypothetical protein
MSFRYSLFYLWNASCFHVLCCSDYSHLFPLDPVTTAVWLVSFHPIILSIFHLTVAYAPSIHNNLDSLWLKLFLTLKTWWESANGWSRDTQRNTCTNSYVIAENSRPMTYLMLKVICRWKYKDWSIQKLCLFYPQNNSHCLNNFPKHVAIFLILQTFNLLSRLNHKRWPRTYCEWNALIHASFSKMQSVLVHLW